ncbi:hypothetical protein [Elioraea sp.]|nr:hypothetical protein [Elioraea sp.]
MRMILAAALFVTVALPALAGPCNEAPPPAPTTSSLPIITTLV